MLAYAMRQSWGDRRPIMVENRKYPRKKVTFSALFKGGRQPLERVRVRDISRGGLFIEVDEPPRAGDVVIVNIDAYDFGKDLSLKCEVARSVSGHGMGLSILQTTDDQYLREWVAR